MFHVSLQNSKVLNHVVGWSRDERPHAKGPSYHNASGNLDYVPFKIKNRVTQ